MIFSEFSQKNLLEDTMEATNGKRTYTTKHVCFMKGDLPVFVVGVANMLGDTDEKSAGCMMTGGAH